MNIYVAIYALALVAVLSLICLVVELILLGLMRSPCRNCGAGIKCGCGKISR